MAVDQAKHMNFLMLNNNSNSNPIEIGNNLYSNTSNVTSSLGGVAGASVLPATANESLLLPFYNLNDVVFPKLPPAVKDDSGVTFNNSLVPRKRQRESAFPITSTNSSLTRKHSGGLSFLGEDLSLQIVQQQLELDRLISHHIEKIRREIEERKKQQLRRMMGTIEEAMARKIRDKEAEMDKICKINWALEERVKTLCLENQIWRDLATTNEATANALRSNLEQVLQQVRDNVENIGGELTDDAVSCCGSSGSYEEREKEEDEDQQWRKKKKMRGDGKKWIYRGKYDGKGEKEESKRVCWKCGEGESSVLLLPCRHLCLCTSCGPAVDTCPICNSAKNASVHVNLS